MTDAPAVIKIDNWSFCTRGGDMWMSPELAIELYGMGIHGVLLNHPRHTSGKEATTSRIIAKRGKLIVTESGSLYELGTIDPKYDEFSPNALQKMMDILPEG